MGSGKYLKINLLKFVFMPHALTLHSVKFERVMKEEGKGGGGREWERWGGREKLRRFLPSILYECYSWQKQRA
jgi:hypothetical protein